MPLCVRIQQQGLTLLELLIVAVIIGLLSFSAVYAYQHYTKRTYVAEGLGVASGAKASVSEYYSSEGKWPDSNAMAGFDNSDLRGNAIKSVEIQAGGLIVITYNVRVVDGAQLVLTPTVTNGPAIHWVCSAVSGSGMRTSYLPSHCRTTTSLPSSSSSP